MLKSRFPRTTPVIIFGVASTTLTGDIATDITNGHLQTVVRADPDCRRFVYTGSLAASFWLDAYHPTGAGYDQIGKMAAAEFVYGPTRTALIDAVRGFLRPQLLGRPTMRNLITGGDFTTNPWQRGTSFAAVANGTYTADRWRSRRRSGSRHGRYGGW